MNIRQTIAQWFYSPGAYGLWLALDDVENWRQYMGDIWNYDPRPDRTRESVVAQLKTGSPFRFNGYDKTPPFLGPIERWPLYFKFKKIRNRQMLYRFTRLEEAK